MLRGSHTVTSRKRRNCGDSKEIRGGQGLGGRAVNRQSPGDSEGCDNTSITVLVTCRHVTAQGPVPTANPTRNGGLR